MRRFSLPAVGAAAAVCLLVPLTPVWAAVTAPKSGARYAGKTERDRPITLRVSGRSVEVLAFKFDCGRKALASTSITSLPLTRTDAGYAFKVSANAIVSYADEEPDENGTIFVKGRFSRTARTVAGVLRVTTPRCHSTGNIDWRAKR